MSNKEELNQGFKQEENKRPTPLTKTQDTRIYKILEILYFDLCFYLCIGLFLVSIAGSLFYPR